MSLITQEIFGYDFAFLQFFFFYFAYVDGTLYWTHIEMWKERLQIHIVFECEKRERVRFDSMTSSLYLKEEQLVSDCKQRNSQLERFNHFISERLRRVQTMYNCQ